MSFIVAIDFDGTLSQYDGWRGKGEYGPPVEGAWEACWDLFNDDCKLVVWTCRNNEDDDIQAWLAEHDFPWFEAINRDLSGLPDRSPKIVADVYLDDRAAFWQGWEGVPEWVREFRERHYAATHACA